VASIDGMVLDRKVTIGQVVQPAEIAFVIADLSNVWLVADVPEQNAGNIVVGKEVEAEIPALPDLVLHGKLSFVSSRVNPDTRTVRTRMDVPNPRRKFKPAMLASMVLKDGVERQRVIPATAVVREGNEDHVFIQTDANTFVLREVTLGAEYDNTRVLMTGVEPGERIVLDGAFHLNNERKRLALQGGD
jgi:cobalt-zinc-cadmium efflux system membrane fusion protein